MVDRQSNAAAAGVPVIENLECGPNLSDRAGASRIASSCPCPIAQRCPLIWTIRSTFPSPKADVAGLRVMDVEV